MSKRCQVGDCCIYVCMYVFLGLCYDGSGLFRQDSLKQMRPEDMKNSKKKMKNKTSSNTDPLSGDLSSLFSSSDWKKIKFELRPKNKSITIRISEEMLDAIKSKAQDEGLDYQKWIRSSIEDALNKTA